MEWMGVKDKTPEDFNSKHFCCHEAVLVYSDISGPPRTGIAIYEGEGKWKIAGNMGAHSDTGFYDLSSEHITHWGFLPDSPGKPIDLKGYEFQRPKVPESFMKLQQEMKDFIEHGKLPEIKEPEWSCKACGCEGFCGD